MTLTLSYAGTNTTMPLTTGGDYGLEAIGAAASPARECPALAAAAAGVTHPNAVNPIVQTHKAFS